MLIIVVCQFIAPKVGVASPLILLVVGLAIGFLPQVEAIEIEPHIILEVVLPPLLFSAAVRMPTMDFRREMQAVAMLAIPLVFLSAFAVGFVINWLVPAISLPWGVALGAVLSPTDAVAVSIATCSGVSHRIITVLEGEGLFNDATSLVLLSAAMSAGLAADEHALNPGLLIGKVAIALGIAAGIGWVVGEVGVPHQGPFRQHRFLFRDAFHRLDPRRAPGRLRPRCGRRRRPGRLKPTRGLYLRDQ